MWKIATTAEFDDWFIDLNDDEKVELIAKVALLERFGPQLGRPHADTLKDSEHANMKELRGKTSTAVLRVAFAFDTNREAILLVGGNKAGVNERRFYKVLIEQADTLFTRHLAKLAGRRKDKGHG